MYSVDSSTSTMRWPHEWIRGFCTLHDSGSGAEVYFVIVRGADGSHHFVGECAAGGENLFRERFSGTYDATIDSIIGLTDRARISHILLDSRSSPTSSPS
jgi:hypothetical protein